MPFYAIKPSSEQALRSNSAVPPAWLTTALGLIMVPVVFTLLLTAVGLTDACAGDLKRLSVSERVRLKNLLASAVQANEATQAQYEASLRLVEGSPCRGVDSSLKPDLRVKLEAAIAKQTGIAGIEVFQLLRLSGWTVIYSNAGAGDSPYYFYSTDPLAGSPPTAVWAGGAPIYEAGEVAVWVTENAPGIPRKLADCFAWRVILGSE